MTSQRSDLDATRPVDGPGTSRDDRASIDKAISLLTAFGADAATGLGVSELARRAALNKSTAFRVLAMLERNGVVERVGREYRLGARLADLGRSVDAPEHDRVRDQLTPFATDLYVATHETVHLAALHGTDIVYLAKLHGHRQVKVPSRVGGRVPAQVTAAGAAMLAFDPEAYELVLRPGTTTGISLSDDLNARLETIRRTGVALTRESAGLSSVAAPVFGPDGIAVAALSVTASAARLDHRVQAALRAVAAGASRMMSRRRATGLAAASA